MWYTDKFMVAFLNDHLRLSVDTLNNSGLHAMTNEDNQLVSPLQNRVYSWFSALASEDFVLMEDLLTHGLPVDVPHPLRHTTALMEATRLGRTALVQWLLARGAAPAFLCGLPKGTPLHCALRQHQWDIAQLLLEQVPTASMTDAHTRTPLHIMAMDMPEDEPKHAEGLFMAIALIDRGCALDALDDEGITALHYAVINDDQLMARVLLGAGATADACTPERGVTPLMIAAIEKNAAMANLLIAYGADPYLQNSDGTCPADVMPGLKRIAARMQERPGEMRATN
ncbi:MAG: hypothetical protein DI582_07150 [Azospirillum brasilense]|nr:MAG: hypothetical protein DI582_07150 [Azospirillum brasilense]